MWSSVAFAKAVAAQQEDLGVLDETVRNRCGDGGVVKDIAPFGKCRVSPKFFDRFHARIDAAMR
jgi:hypothetical protein